MKCLIIDPKALDISSIDIFSEVGVIHNDKFSKKIFNTINSGIDTEKILELESPDDYSPDVSIVRSPSIDNRSVDRIVKKSRLFSVFVIDGMKASRASSLKRLANKNDMHISIKEVSLLDYGIPHDKKTVVATFSTMKMSDRINTYSDPCTKDSVLSSNIDRKYKLSDATMRYVTKDQDPKNIDRPVFLEIKETMHKMHRSSIDNYVSFDGGIRRLTPQEVYRLIGWKVSDSFIFGVSDTQAYSKIATTIPFPIIDGIKETILESIRDTDVEFVEFDGNRLMVDGLSIFSPSKVENGVVINRVNRRKFILKRSDVMLIKSNKRRVVAILLGDNSASSKKYTRDLMSEFLKRGVAGTSKFFDPLKLQV